MAKKKFKLTTAAIIAIVAVVSIIFFTTFSEQTGFATAAKYPVSFITTPVSGTDKGSLTINLDQEYLNVNSIFFNAVPGGQICDAAIKLTAYDATGKAVGSATAKKVASHTATTGTLTLANARVKKLVGKPVAENVFPPRCDKIDSLKATIAISDDKNSPIISKPSVNAQTQQIQQGAFKAIITNSVAVSVSATDIGKVSQIDMFVGDVLAKSCTFSSPVISSGCTYSLTDIPADATTKSLKINAYDNAPVKNMNTLTTTFTVGPKVKYVLG